jgi:hypothetical protein
VFHGGAPTYNNRMQATAGGLAVLSLGVGHSPAAPDAVRSAARKQPGMTFTRLVISTAGFITMAGYAPVLAESILPTNIPPEICDLAVAADQEPGDVVVTWSGGTPPFTIVRSDAEDLATATRLEVVAQNQRTSRFVDRGASRAGNRSYYQVYDVNSVPVVFGLSPDGGLPGSKITVRGVALRSDCDELTVRIAGHDVPTKFDCSFTGFSFKVPVDAFTGSVIVATPAGATVVGAEEAETCKGEPRRPRSW